MSFPAFNMTDKEYPADCVHVLFQRQVALTPEAVALRQGGQSFTRRQVDESANRIAHALQRRGVGRESFVGVLLEQSVDAVVAILGILKAGAVYIPMDPSWPKGRISDILRDSGAAIVLTRTSIAGDWHFDAQPLCIDDSAAGLAAESTSTPASSGDLDSAAYVLYTSGSTGKPKGVVGIHRSIVNGLLSVTYAKDETCCLNASLSFGFSLANMFLPLMSGVPLVILPQEQIRDVMEFMKCLARESITRVALLPTVFRQILEFPDAALKLRSVRVVGLAGAALTSDVLKRFAEVMPHAELHNCYSSTEIGTLATLWDVTPAAAATGDIVIGRPVANTRIYLLDEARRPVPVGEIGEIYVGARHLARGYLNEPELTADRFSADPFRQDENDRVFRSGDLGRLRPDGEIEFVGRADEQVKIRGFRIELLEVERALADHDGLLNVAVAAREIGGQLRLVAYVVADSERVTRQSRLRDALRGRLPEYMIPSAFVFVDRLPVSENGKIDRAALPEPDVLRPELDSQYEAPGTEFESSIAGIWSGTFGLSQIGMNDNFVELGGDSLAAAQVAASIAEQFGVEVSLETLFDHPTIAEIAEYVSRHVGSAVLNRV